LSGSGKDERWDTLILGDVHTPLVQELPGGGHEIIFTYVLGPKEYVLAVRDYTVGSPVNLQPLLAKDGITCTRHEADGLGGLAVAWINKLRSAGQVHDQLIARPFGWNFLNGACTGLAIGGVLYRPGGMVERVACDDKKLAATYRPMGELAVWRRAAHLFEGKRPDLQALIACAFGAPLISLTGDVRGMTLNFWSAGSGIGKSTAIKIGQSVWGNYTAMQSMRDTPNSVMRSLAGPRVLIRYWDEFRITRDRQGEFVELVYTLPQGKERMRLMADITIRETGEWDTMLAMTSNKSHADVLLLDNDGTDSGLLRLLEIEMDKQMMPFDAAAGPLIKATETNYGHAGRIYAAYLGAQVDAVRLQLAAVSETLGRDLNLQQDERYYAAAIATIVVGATIACHLDLFAFDVHAIYDVLKRAVIASRSARQVRTVVTGAGRYELGPIMAQFINAMGDHLIRTDVLATAGSGKVTPIVTPKSSSIIKAQIAEKAGMIRLHREEFFRWLAVRNLPSAPVLDQMGQDWNARQKRAALAGGTSYATGQLWVVDVPRGDPELEAYFDTGGRP
ncbi:MAG TPA: DUF927 domain-containing protein, partial [Steroidobacteraceae bacterium]|nr:DUF927 domain-containing protein [Steroidobacteraceae bacterium]